jgi:hypothetical protein
MPSTLLASNLSCKLSVSLRPPTSLFLSTFFSFCKFHRVEEREIQADAHAIFLQHLFRDYYLGTSAEDLRPPTWQLPPGRTTPQAGSDLPIPLVASHARPSYIAF